MLEAELLLSEYLNCDKVSLYQQRNRLLEKKEAKFISSVLERRISREPLQYILGKAWFMGQEFKTTTECLIPRPETEILVETALKSVSRLTVNSCRLKILDIGTGSGCIAISLAKNFPEAEIDAVDISKKTLEVARENALMNNVNINFIQADLFNAYGLQLKAYDLIVSNPPYIPSAEIDKLQPEISYEPRIALDGGKDGLDFYRRIIAEGGNYLKDNGLLILEIGDKQLVAIKNIFKKSNNFEIIEVVKDYNQRDRVIVAKRKI